MQTQWDIAGGPYGDAWDSKHLSTLCHLASLHQAQQEFPGHFFIGIVRRVQERSAQPLGKRKAGAQADAPNKKKAGLLHR